VKVIEKLANFIDLSESNKLIKARQYINTVAIIVSGSIKILLPDGN